MQSVTDTAETRVEDARPATHPATALLFTGLQAALDDVESADEFSAPIAADDVRRAIRNALFS